MRLRITTSVLAVATIASAVWGLGHVEGPPSTLVGINADTAYATAGPAPRGAAGPAGPAAPTGSTNSSNVFTISGTVSGLFPGATLPLVLTVTDTKNYAITVSSISAVVSSQTTGCAGSNVTISSFTGSLAVAAKHSAHTTVSAQMSHGAPDACQGAKFKILYSGSGAAA